jgi:hypothetical protein
MKGQHAGTPGAIELRLSPWRSAFLLVACVAFVAIGWLMAHDPSPDHARNRFWGWASVLFFGFLFPFAVRELFRQGPRLIVSDAGIDDRALGLGLIPWSEIAGFELREMNREKFLMLHMHDQDAWEARRPAAKRWAFALNRAIGFQGIPITVSGLTMSAEEIVRQVQRRARER